MDYASGWVFGFPDRGFRTLDLGFRIPGPRFSESGSGFSGPKTEVFGLWTWVFGSLNRCDKGKYAKTLRAEGAPDFFWGFSGL